MFAQRLYHSILHMSHTLTHADVDIFNLDRELDDPIHAKSCAALLLFEKDHSLRPPVDGNIKSTVSTDQRTNIYIGYPLPDKRHEACLWPRQKDLCSIPQDGTWFGEN